MMILLGYFLIAAIAGVAASATIGFVLTHLLVSRFEKANRPIAISSDQTFVIREIGRGEQHDVNFNTEQVCNDQGDFGQVRIL